MLAMACSSSDENTSSTADGGTADTGQTDSPREAGATTGGLDGALADTGTSPDPTTDAGGRDTGTKTDPTLDAGGANGIVYAFDGKAVYATKSPSAAAISATKLSITGATSNPGVFQDIVTIQVVNAVGTYACSSGDAMISLSAASGPVYQANTTLGSCSVHVTKAAGAAQETIEATFTATVKNVQGADTHQMTSGSIKAVRTI